LKENVVIKHLIIVGGGGCGRQALAQLRVDPCHGIDWQVQGFLDERGRGAVSTQVGMPWLGLPGEFLARASQRFVVAVGDTARRRVQVEALLARGAQFMAVSTRCTLGERTTLGRTFVGFDVSTGVDCRIGDFSFIDIECRLGHDVVIEDYVQMGPRCLLAGHVHVETGATVHSGALIARGVRIGAHATVGLGAVVFHDVPAGATVLGNPARVIFRRPAPSEALA
jgi:sugar O-acyltransferase (sialic acid O-acetyltransferase NeuD family)